MQENFSFNHDPSKRLLTIRVHGFWNQQVLAEFIKQVESIARGVAAAHHDRVGRVLIDFTDFPVQAMDLTAELASLMPRFGKLTAKVAVVPSASMIQRMQAARFLSSSGFHQVTSVEEGVRWLLAD